MAEPHRPPLVPVYFQTTRSAVRYAPKGGYTDEQVQTYILGETGLSRRLKTEIVSFTGVTEDGLDLTYIDKSWWSGLPNSKREKFLLKPCGGSSNPTANTGEIDTASWLEAFRTLFKGDDKEKRLRPDRGAAPLFSIIDADTAHHLSAPLVERAVTALGKRDEGRKTVVINFDRHWDYNSTRPSIITCAKWGYFAVYSGADADDKPLPRSALADAYVHFGGKKDDLAYAAWHPGTLTPEKAPEKTTPFGDKAPMHQQVLSKEPRSITEQIKRIRDAIPPGATGCNAYVTCDRDFMQRNFTPWNDGFFEPETGMRGILECLDALQTQGFILIGFDITGLPDVNASKQTNFSHLEAAELADKQITQLWEAVSKVVAAQRY